MCREALKRTCVFSLLLVFLDLRLSSSVPRNLKRPHKHEQFCFGRGRTIISQCWAQREKWSVVLGALFL